MAASAMQNIQATIEGLDEPKRSREFYEPMMAQFEKQRFTVMHRLEGAKIEDLIDFAASTGGLKTLARMFFWQLDTQELAAPNTPMDGRTKIFQPMILHP